jgi:hypothetical protein
VGWDGEVRRALWLNDATISLGPPHEHADLVPDSGRPADSIRHYSHLNRPPWLTCFYGRGNEFVLSSPLPAGTVACEIRKHRHPDGVTLVEVNCTL